MRWLLLLAALPSLAGEWWCVEGEVVSLGPSNGPQFSKAAREAARAGIVVAAGQPAELACRVTRLHDKTVSWVRSRDLGIVCHAGASFTADARVSCDASRDPRGESHALHVDRARLADSGLYECQVNTEPKMSLFFNLTVVDEPVPVVVMEDSGPASGAPGGATTLSCGARYSPAPRLLPAPALHVAWWHGGAPVGVRGGVSLESEAAAGAVISRLTLTALQPSDAGQYTCSAGNVSATLELHVDDQFDQNRALDSPLEAMQRDESGGGVAGGSAGVAGDNLLPPLLCMIWTLIIAIH